MNKLKRAVSLLMCVLLMTLTLSGTLGVTAGAATEVKGKTVAEVLGMSGSEYMKWLYSHQSDDYYLGTPYKPYDCRNPKGDCAGAYGANNTKGVAAMNCTGFVWHVLMKATKASSGKTNLIPTLSGWVNFYRSNNISRRYFSTKSEMLQSGYLEKGDIIWMFQNQSETAVSDEHHVGIYWGNGSGDVFWHSIGAGGDLQGNVRSKIVPRVNNNVMYVVLKVMPRSYIKVKKTSSDPGISDGNPEYSFKGIEYYVSKSPTDFDYSANGKNYLGYIKLNENGEGVSKDGSRATIQSLAPGTYYVKEGYIPPGCKYERDETVYTVTVTAKHTAAAPYVLNVSDAPMQTPATRPSTVPETQPATPATQPPTVAETQPQAAEPQTTPPAEENLSLNKTSLKLGVGEKYTLTVSGALSEVKWSADSTAVSVTNNGDGSVSVKAKASGKATVTATAASGSTAKCEIAVAPMAKSLTLNKTSLTLGVGEEFDLNSTIPGGTAAYYRLYTTSKQSVASVTASGGIVKAKSAGTADIICTMNNGVKAKCVVTVKPLARSLTLNKTSVKLRIGETFDLNSTVPAGYAAYYRYYYSRNTAVAKVTKSGGVITGVKAGKTTVYCELLNGKTAECTVQIVSN